MTSRKTMSKAPDFRIEFDRPDATYAPGETVSGKVIVNLPKPSDIRGILLKARGKAKVYWVEKRKGHTHEYKNKEDYFRISNQLAGSETGNRKITLPAGQHSYDFAIPLPVNIPSSFEHPDGFIRYAVKAILDRPSQSYSKIVSPFTVVVPCDLKALKAGIRDQFERKFLSAFLCSAGKIEFDVKSQNSAFVPGDAIEVIVNIDNRSEVDISQIELKLKRNLTFYASGNILSKSKLNSEALNNIIMDGPFTKQSELSLKFNVPPLSQPNLTHCSIIDVNYRLILIVHFPGMYSPIRRMYPVQLS